MDPEPSLPSWPDESSLMTAPNDDEFSNFLEFGMPFPDLGPHSSSSAAERPPPRSLSSIPSTTTAAPPSQTHLVRMDTDPAASSPSVSLDFQNGAGHVASQGPPSAGLPVTYSTTTATMTPSFYAQEPHQPLSHPSPFHNHLSHQQHQHQHQQQPQESPHPPSSHFHSIPNGQHMIPPTPNSVELHGSAARYPQRVDKHHEMYDQYTRMTDEQAYYTPLISPAMTPLETQFRLPEYTIPGEYFTPLTSPALEAQNANSNNGTYPFTQGGQISDVGFLQSPVDSAIPASSAPSSPGLVRKHRRQPSTATNRFSARAKKQQSPSVRPQTRKKSLLNINSDEVLNGLNQDDQVAASKPRANGVNELRLGSNESSGQDSVSPEPLSEPLMPPPAIPQPQARKSPAIAPQLAAAQVQTNNAPATPAMLMRIQRSQQHNQDSTGQFTGQAKLVPGANDSRDDVMTDISLPEAATTPSTPATQHNHAPRPKMTRIDTAIHSGVPTPAASTNATPALEPKSAPVANPSSSVAPSPRSLAMPSPSGPIAKKSDTPKLGPSNSRKRPSLSSAQPSPQLRPKISPSIQPLVPRGDVSNETSAMFLASKSNYQHILDGTLLPGVSYPETLAENLSSKRTNHKLAEQGRRNRINNALKEIETLIPENFAQMKNAKEAAACNVKPSDKEKEKAGNQAISKASTVEMAIDYIKALQTELITTKTKLVDAESQLGKKEANKDDASAPCAETDKESSTDVESMEAVSDNNTQSNGT